MHKRFVAGAIALALALPAAAQNADNLINQPGVTWTFYGTLVQQKAVNDKDVLGGHAIRATVAKGANAYDAGAQTPIAKGVKKGDRLVFAFYVKSPTATKDHMLSIPALIQINQAPYSADVTGSVDVGPAWQLVHISGTANADHAAGSIVAALQISGDRQVLDLGPAYVMDLGQ